MGLLFKGETSLGAGELRCNVGAFAHVLRGNGARFGDTIVFAFGTACAGETRMDPREDLTSVIHDIASTLERGGNVQAVFGQPMKLDTHTVIPVATVSMGGGGGGVRAFGAAVDTVRRWLSLKPVHVTPGQTFAGGGGGGLDVRPVGFLCEQEGRVVFTVIDDGRRRPALK